MKIDISEIRELAKHPKLTLEHVLTVEDYIRKVETLMSVTLTSSSKSTIKKLISTSIKKIGVDITKLAFTKSFQNDKWSDIDRAFIQTHFA